MLQRAKVVEVSEPLTINEIMERTWLVGDPIPGEELLLYDTVPWMPYDYDLDPPRLVRYDERGEPEGWGIDEALSLLQSFYHKPIDWERERWVVLMLRWTDDGGELSGTLRFSRWYPKLNYPMFSTIRKAGSRSARFTTGDVVGVEVEG